MNQKERVPEQIASKLRQVDVLHSWGRSVGDESSYKTRTPHILKVEVFAMSCVADWQLHGPRLLILFAPRTGH